MSPMDSIEKMMDLTSDVAQRADLTVTFVEPRDAQALHELRSFPGVLRAEPFRVAATRLRAGHRVEREGLDSAARSGGLRKVVDVDGSVAEPPPHGAIVSVRLARELGVGVGDRIDTAVTEGERPRFDLPVVGVVDSPVGSSVMLDRATLNRLLLEGDTLSGAYLEVDPAQLPALYRRIKETPFVAGISSREEARRALRESFAESFSIQVWFYVGFASLVIVGVVYNSARISLSERARDLASLRVLGFRKSETAYVLLGEQAILVLLSIPLGLWLGIFIWQSIASAFETDLFSLPMVIDPRTLAQGVLIVFAASGATALLIWRQVARLDMVSALKTRE
jgi:putative ABC transport system permease protein